MPRFNIEPFFAKVPVQVAQARLAAMSDNDLCAMFGPWDFRNEAELTPATFRPAEPEYEYLAERIRAVLERDLRTVYSGATGDPYDHLYGRGFDPVTRLPIFYVLYDQEMADADADFDDNHCDDDDDEDRERYDSHTNANAAHRLNRLRLCREAEPNDPPLPVTPRRTQPRVNPLQVEFIPTATASMYTTTGVTGTAWQSVFDSDLRASQAREAQRIILEMNDDLIADLQTDGTEPF